MTRTNAKKTTRLYQSTFTYFIPSPPKRSDGYREREIDKITRGMTQEGFNIDNVLMESVDHGVFVIFTLSTKSKKTFLKDQHQEIHLDFTLNSKSSSPDIIHDNDSEHV